MVEFDSTINIADSIPSVLKGDLFIVTSDDRFLMYSADKAFRKSQSYGMILHGEQALIDYLSKVPDSVSPDSLQIFVLGRRGKVSVSEVQRIYDSTRTKEG